MRALQGIAVAVIIVSKRVYFVDTFSGDQLKRYTSLFVVVWTAAPIGAPFLGGFLQSIWGWSANFYFLGIFALLVFLAECVVGKESLNAFLPFHYRSVINAYASMIRAADFSAGVIILGLGYTMLLVYGMASPFLIENRLHYSASVTGYCSLLSGIAVFAGNSIARFFTQKPFFKKIVIANSLQLLFLAGMIPLTLYFQSLLILLLYVVVLHSLAGFIFNTMYSYCMIRFSQHAGKASGLVGGGFSVITSLCSAALVNLISISDQTTLGVVYAILATGILLLMFVVKWRE